MRGAGVSTASQAGIFNAPGGQRLLHLCCSLHVYDTQEKLLSACIMCLWQAEQEAQARSHAVRLSELQESCHQKIRQLQKMHREQLASAQASAAAALSVAAAPAASAAVTGIVLDSSFATPNDTMSSTAFFSSAEGQTLSA